MLSTPAPRILGIVSQGAVNLDPIACDKLARADHPLAEDANRGVRQIQIAHALLQAAGGKRFCHGRPGDQS